MLDHIILTVRNFAEAIAFYEAVLPHLNILERQDYAGKAGPPGHPDLKGFGANGRLFFWLREGTPHPDAVHVGFVADSEKAVQAAYSAALAAGAVSKHVPGPQYITILDTTELRSLTWTVIPLSSSTKAGSTENESKSIAVL